MIQDKNTGEYVRNPDVQKGHSITVMELRRLVCHNNLAQVMKDGNQPRTSINDQVTPVDSTMRNTSPTEGRERRAKLNHAPTGDQWRQTNKGILSLSISL